MQRKKARRQKTLGKTLEGYEKSELRLSLERTILSKERTVLTEITVLLGFITLGVAIIKFFENSARAEILVFGYGLLVFATAGVFFSIYNYKKYTAELKTLEEGNKIIPDEE